MARRYMKRQNTANRRRTYYRRKKNFRYSMAGRRLGRLGASSLYRPTHYFIRSTEIDATALTANIAGQLGTGFIGKAYTYQLNSLINHTDFNSLYDQYKIIAVKHHFKWSLDSTVPADNLLSNPPVMYHFTDNDDNSAPSHDTFTERATTKQFAMRANKVYTITLKPACLQEIYRTSVTTAYVPKWNQFIDMGNDNVPHYGLKVGWMYPGNLVYGNLVSWYSILFACKGVK